MKRLIVRSQIFNLFFYVLTAIACVVCLPTLFLPRKYFMGVVHGFVRTVYFLERIFLGLDFEIRGKEHVPQTGSFIVAAKHQSPYETMKLHLLFKDPAIILKKELLSIPLWGLYLKKSDVIAIDRSSPDAAITSIQEGAKRMAAQNRPIVIFPQGTRVPIDQTPKHKPYKIGVVRIAEATGLPIIPLALNTGLFWPRSGWLKSSGTVIFEFLSPLNSKMERSELLKVLEQTLESASLSLSNEAKEKAGQTGHGLMAGMMGGVAIILLAFAGYSALWTNIAEHIRAQYPVILHDMVGSAGAIAQPHISGYPGKIKVFVAEQTLKNSQGSVSVKDIKAESWPLPRMTADIQTGPIEIKNLHWPAPLIFDSFSAKLRLIEDKKIGVQDSVLQYKTFRASVTGTADFKQEPVPLLELQLKLEDHQALLQDMGTSGIIEPRMALFLNAGLSALSDGQGIVEVPLNQKDDGLYAGPLRIMTLPKQRELTYGEYARETAAPPAPSP